jgi:DNA-binding NarL/FixJ family response regulator
MARTSARPASVDPDTDDAAQTAGGWIAVASGIDWPNVQTALGLSTREAEVVQHIFRGQKLVAVARDMDLGLGTVKTYMQRVHHKLGVTDQRELILAVVNTQFQLARSSVSATPRKAGPANRI